MSQGSALTATGPLLSNVKCWSETVPCEPRGLPGILIFSDICNSTRFFFFFHPIFIRAWFLQKKNRLLHFLTFFTFQTVQLFSNVLVRCKGNSFKLWSMSGKLEEDCSILRLDSKHTQKKVASVTNWFHYLTHISFQSMAAAALRRHPPVWYWIFQSLLWQLSYFLKNISRILATFLCATSRLSEPNVKGA